MGKEQLHQLRVKFIALNIEHTRRVENRESFTELESLNQEIKEIIEAIQVLEKEIKPG